MTWGNCESQSLQFSIRSSTLTIEVSTLGKISNDTGYLGGCLSTPCIPTAPADGSVVYTLPIYPYQSISPNAIILHVSGNLTAYDPVAGAISQQESFRT
jgi:hypothetical protein